MNLIEYDFDCPFCGLHKKTLVTKTKLQKILSRTEPIQNILNPAIFNASYRELFISSICTSCSKSVFKGKPDDPIFDVKYSENTDSIKPLITKMYELDSEE